MILMQARTIWFLALAFKTNVWWGVGCLLFPPVQWVYLVTHFERSAPAFILSLAGVVVGVLVAGPAVQTTLLQLVR